MNFYENFIGLCEFRHESPSRVVQNLGLSKSIVTRWKNGGMPSESTVHMLAEYFGVTCDFMKHGVKHLTYDDYFIREANRIRKMVNDPSSAWDSDLSREVDSDVSVAFKGSNEKGPAEPAEPKKEDNSLSIEFLQKMAQLTPEQRKLVESYMSFLLSTQG